MGSTDVFTDLQQIDYFKVMSLFQTFKGRSLQINVIGTIVIPFFINSFDYADYKTEIAFGNCEDEDNWFYLEKAKDLGSVWYAYDNFISADNIVFKMEYDIFTTWIHIACELEGIEMDAG